MKAKRKHLFLPLLCLLFSTLSVTAQFELEQLRLPPLVINDAALFQGDLYIATERGIYRNSLTGADWQLATNSRESVKDIAVFKENLYFSATSAIFYGENYCPGQITGSRSGRIGRISDESNSQTIYSDVSTYGSGFGSSSSFACSPIQLVDDNYFYVPLLRVYGGTGGIGFSGSRIVHTDKDSEEIQKLNIAMTHFAYDGNFFYGILGNRLFKSAEPDFESYEEIDISNVADVNVYYRNKAFQFSNNQLYIFNLDSIYISIDQGINWVSHLNPNADLVFDKFENGQFHFKRPDQKVGYSIHKRHYHPFSFAFSTRLRQPGHHQY